LGRREEGGREGGSAGRRERGKRGKRQTERRESLILQAIKLPGGNVNRQPVVHVNQCGASRVSR